jgi:hypothetical protein
MYLVSNLIGVAYYFIFVIAVCISPVFASEYESGAAALLLTTKYWKIDIVDVIGNFISYRFKTVILSYLGMVVVVYAAVGILSFLGIRNRFANHQVNH